MTSEPMQLTAGPIRCKFADGELRYLYVGDKEIVRRVYFAVRDGSWNTAMPRFTKAEVRRNGNGFTIDLAADCRTDTADFSWTGRIEGTNDGRITFRAGGAANRPFRSNRIGLCVLYGTPSVVGQAYETVGQGGEVTRYTFPEYVSAKLVAPNYRTLRYTTAGGMTVTTDVTGSAHFDMEDQRTYSDSSFKAYAPLAYDYKQDIPQGARLEETVTISVTGAPKGADKAVTSGPVTVRVGAALPGAKMPKITQAPADARPGLFGDVNGRAEQHKGASALTWGYDPSVHLPDEDTLFENVLAVGDQVRSAHSYAPGAAITLSPVLLSSRPGKWGAAYAHSGDDPLQSAWSAALVKQAALAGVGELAFGFGPGLGRTVQEELAAFSGRPLRTVTLSGPLPSPVEALAVDGDGGRTALWLVNVSRRPQRAVVEGITGGAVELRWTNRSSATAPLPLERNEKPGARLTVDLAPYEVCRVEYGGTK